MISRSTSKIMGMGLDSVARERCPDSVPRMHADSSHPSRGESEACELGEKSAKALSPTTSTTSAVPAAMGCSSRHGLFQLASCPLLSSGSVPWIDCGLPLGLAELLCVAAPAISLYERSHPLKIVCGARARVVLVLIPYLCLHQDAIYVHPVAPAVDAPFDIPDLVKHLIRLGVPPFCDDYVGVELPDGLHSAENDVPYFNMGPILLERIVFRCW